MSKVNIYIDGTWLINACKPAKNDGFLSKNIYYAEPHWLNFSKLKHEIQKHIKRFHSDCTEFGNCYFVTALFSLPDDCSGLINATTKEGKIITRDALDKLKWNVEMREKYVELAKEAGFSDDGTMKVDISRSNWIIPAFSEGRYREKQVDTTVVALLVRDVLESVRSNSDEYFALVAGDADILPAVKVAFPQYTEKLFWVGVHPDQYDTKDRLSSFAYFDYFKEEQKIMFLENSLEKIVDGYAYKCEAPGCGLVYVNRNEKPLTQKSLCPTHRVRKT